MFGFFKKSKGMCIVSPQNGTAVPLTEVPDEAFSGKMLGDGIAVIPDGDDVLSPVNGVVVQIPDTLHAYGIQSDDGLDILIHIGVNTVEMKGKGFESFVKEGDKVKIGDRIAKADIKFLKEEGYPVHTPVLITNPDDVKDLSFELGKVKAGDTKIIKYKK